MSVPDAVASGPHVVGGYLFGFSASILRDQLWGNFHVTAVFLLSRSIALVVVRASSGEELELTRARVGASGCSLRFQVWISTEFTFTATVFLVLAVVLAFWLIRPIRPRIRAALQACSLRAMLLAGVIATPILVLRSARATSISR